MVKIVEVEKGSVAEKCRINKGDYLLAYDGYRYRDILDYIYYNSQAKFTVTIKDVAGKERVINVSKSEDKPLGITLEEEELKIIPCRNKCIFCFVDQCAKGMRDTLYVKDDDYRLSFISGNYVTLSNVSEEDIERIIRLKLSPLYVSVHCFDKALKKKICANPSSAELFNIMDRLIEGGIVMHTQVVMMEGINDGAILKETMQELYSRYPAVKSLAVVPVGLTKHREGLYPIAPLTAECARRTIKQAEAFNEIALADNGEGFVWCSDEMYMLSGLPIPEYDTYGSFPQIENGVGMISELLYEIRDELLYTSELKGEYTLVTGTSFAPVLKNIAVALEDVYGIKLDVRSIINNFFGESVTVAGLITGGDIIAQLKGNLKYKNLIIPHNMLKEFESVFLDGLSVEAVEKELNCKIHISQNGESFIKIIAGEKNG
ncbi:MAG: DUF512 domain-containing protein [Clostridia bacterium]|nr:DUF512 domain-containing protein [Clostridia bacterium]